MTLVFIVLFLSISTFVDNLKEIKVGVIIIKNHGGPYDWRKSGSAIRLAFEKTNSEILNGTGYYITAIERHYGPDCDQKKTPGKFKEIK